MAYITRITLSQITLMFSNNFLTREAAILLPYDSFASHVKVMHMAVRFKKAGVIRSNGKQCWHVPYEEAIADKVKYWWAEDYEI